MAQRSMTMSRGTYAMLESSCAFMPAAKSSAAVPCPSVRCEPSTPAMYSPRASGVNATLRPTPL